MSDRLVVGATFIGWDKITKIIDKADSDVVELLILSLFLTGGRTNEVLALNKKNFDFNSSKHSIVINDMKLSKKYRVIGFDYNDKNELVRITESVKICRDAFPILHREPLVSRYIDCIKRVEIDELFPGISRQLSYYYVTKAGRNAGIRVSDHWFRGQRASQLQEEYLFKKDECETYFGWRKPANDMYARYGSTTWRYLELMMAKGLKDRQEVDEFLSKPILNKKV